MSVILKLMIGTICCISYFRYTQFENHNSLSVFLFLHQGNIFKVKTATESGCYAKLFPLSIVISKSLKIFSFLKTSCVLHLCLKGNSLKTAK